MILLMYLVLVFTLIPITTACVTNALSERDEQTLPERAGKTRRVTVSDSNVQALEKSTEYLNESMRELSGSITAVNKAVTSLGEINTRYEWCEGDHDIAHGEQRRGIYRFPEGPDLFLDVDLGCSEIWAAELVGYVTISSKNDLTKRRNEAGVDARSHDTFVSLLKEGEL